MVKVTSSALGISEVSNDLGVAPNYGCLLGSYVGNEASAFFIRICEISKQPPNRWVNTSSLLLDA